MHIILSQIIYVDRTSCNVYSFFDFKQNGNGLTNFSNKSQYEISLKSVDVRGFDPCGRMETTKIAFCNCFAKLRKNASYTNIMNRNVKLTADSRYGHWNNLQLRDRAHEVSSVLRYLCNRIFCSKSFQFPLSFPYEHLVNASWRAETTHFTPG